MKLAKKSQADDASKLFLSGGIDSSIILSSITSNLNKNKLFYHKFENKSFDETEYSSTKLHLFLIIRYIKNSFISDAKDITSQEI